MQVRQVDSDNRQDVNRFVNFQYDLYRTSELWSPPLASTIKLALNRRRHPFYRHSDAAFFLAEEGRDTVGRVAVLENRHYNAYQQCKTAFFYYFDALDRRDVAGALFDAAGEWARQRGLDTLMGPKGMLRSDAPGVLTEGYEHRAALSMPYNYPYYPALMEASGFEKEKDYISGYLVSSDQLPVRMTVIAEKVKSRSGFRVLTFTNRRQLRKWLPEIQRVNNEAFTEVWGYYPIDDAEIQMIGKQLLAIADPRLLTLVVKDDKIAGFAFVFPDISEALRKTRGRLWPLGWIRLLTAIKTTRYLSGNGIGLLPEHQGLGATALLYVEFNKTLRRRNAIHCDVAQVMETNIKSLGDMNAVGVKWHKRHRVYRKGL